MTSLLAFLLAFSNPGFEFLRLPAFVGPADATSSGAKSVWCNPAGLAEGKDGLSVNFSRWLLDHEFSNLSLKLKNFGFTVRYHSFGDIEFHSERPEDELYTHFRPYAFELGLAYGRHIDPELSIGIGLSWFYNRIYEHSAKNYLLSGGLLYKPKKFEWLSFGLSVMNFGLKTGYMDITYTMPTEVIITGKVEKGIFMGGITSKSVVTYKPDTGLSLADYLNPSKNPGASLELFGQVKLGDMEIGLSYVMGNEVLPLNIALDYRVGKLKFAYGYRMGRLGFNSPMSLNLEMEF